MHILYVHQHFAVPSGASGTRSYKFAKRWINAGHKVTIISGLSDDGGLELKERLIQKQCIDGIDIVVVGTTYSNKQSFARRIISFLSFMFLSTLIGLTLKRFDVVYATSTPLTVGIPAIIIKLFKRKPFIFEVRDQWPEIPIEMEIIKNRFLKRILLCLEKTIYKRSDAIIALSPGMAEGIQEVIGKDKQISIIPNGSDIELFNSNADTTEIREKYGWDKKFVFIHFGAMGKVNNLDFVVNVAGKLREFTKLLFVLIGDGSEKINLIKRTEELKLQNIQILGKKTKLELPQLVAASDVSIVIFADYPILEHNSANKFFDSLSASKPILLNYSGWQRDLLENNNAGFGCKRCNIEEFIEKIYWLENNRKLLNQMGINARKLAAEKFNRDKLAQDALNVIKAVVEKKIK